MVALSFGSICSGIEAASVALEGVGFRPAWFAENAAFPSRVLAERRPGVPNHGDVTRIDTDALAPVDLIIGGTPCQSFSVAGMRKGFEDERGSVTLHYLRIVEALRPKWIVWENVPGVLSSNRGNDFASLVRALAAIGYDLAWRVLDARFFGLPQRRARVYLAGVFGRTADPGSVLAFPEGIRRDPAPARIEGDNDPDDRVRANAGVTYWDGGQMTQTLDAVLSKGQALPEKRRFPAVLVPAWQACACCGDYWCNICRDHCGDCRCGPLETPEDYAAAYDPRLLRYLTPSECERLQGFSGDWTAIPGATKTQRLTAIGNSMAVPVVRAIGRNIAALEGVKQ